MKTLGIASALLLAATAVQANELAIEMKVTTPTGQGPSVGTVKVTATPVGARFSVTLSGLEPMSEHGFHVHENGNCGPKDKNGKTVPALAAGGHWDPEGTGRHEGAEGKGHLGDLPLLVADANGNILMDVTAPRISDLSALKGLALMVHAGGDNYSDKPKQLGGGGARMLCGVIG